jgi:hypothetical protein
MRCVINISVKLPFIKLLIKSTAQKRIFNPFLGCMYHLKISYTLMVFHLPRLNKINAAMAIRVSATGTAKNIPVTPISVYLCSK